MIVVDASVVLKWFLQEDGSDRARALAEAGGLIAPGFLQLECANVLATSVRKGRLDAEGARRAMASLTARRLRFVSDGPNVSAAQSLALELKHSVYDCLYLAVARTEGAALVTADARFFEAASAVALYTPSIRLL